jgi:hypothetical protein
VFVVAKAASEWWEGASSEINGFCDRASIIFVEVSLRGDSSEGHPLMSNFVGTVPEMSAVDCDIVSLVGEACSYFVDAFLGSACDEGVNDIRDESNFH